MKRKVVISVNTAWNIYNFRAGLVKSLIAAGHEVIAVAPHDDYVTKLTELGCEFVALPMDNNGTHPGRDLRLLAGYYSLLRRLRPDAFLGYTVKPNVYGSLAARALGIPTINNIAGLGATFIRGGFISRVVCALYRLALKRSHQVFFQNPDDRRLFIDSGLVPADRAGLVPGSGLNLQHYQPVAPARHNADVPFRFLVVARMLRDKGILEFAEAAHMLRQRGVNAEFQLLGAVDEANPNAVSADQLAAYERDGVLRYLGRTDDVRPYLAAANCVVLPSYREGVPRSLLEAAAMGRPLIATDVPGCRDAVDHGMNGLLCEARNPTSLADAMHAMLGMPAEQLAGFGVNGRRKMENEFDEQLVIQKYLQAIDAIGKPAPALADVGDLVPDQLKS